MADEKKVVPKKQYTIKCKLNNNVTYVSECNINRDTENNNKLIKVSPLFMATLQAKDSSLVTAEQMLKDYCKLKSIEWNADYIYYADKKAEPQAKADTTPAKFTPEQVQTAVLRALKNGINEQELIQKLRTIGVSDDMLRPHCKTLQETTPSIEDLFK